MRIMLDTNAYSGFKRGEGEIIITPIGEETAIFYSEIYSTLRAKGKPIPTNDLWIAASTLETGSILQSESLTFNLQKQSRRCILYV